MPNSGTYTTADLDAPKGQFTAADLDSAPTTPTIGPQPKGTGIMDSISKWTENVMNDVKYGTDTTGIGTVLKKMGAHGVYNGNSQAVGDFMASLPLGLLRAGKGMAELATPGTDANPDTNAKTFRALKDIGGGLTQAATMPTLADTGGTIDAAASLPSLAVRAVKAPINVFRASEAGRALTQTITPEMANAPVAMTRGAATTGGASTAITNGEVLQHAAQEGINLTPAQALRTPAARTEQTLGEEALLTGSKIKEGIAQSKQALADSLDTFTDKLDPQRIGLSAESTGEHLQDSANVARSVLKDNVNDAYAQVRAQQADLAGDVRGPLTQMIHDESFVRQPHAAVEQPVFQTTAAKAAINDIQGMLDDPALQGRQSVQSLRNLRTTLLEKGNDYGANALSDSGQRIYKLAAGKVDDAIMGAAQGTPFEQTFREAGQQNAKLQSLYNQKGSPLYRILNTDDPAAVTNGILNRSSVQEIEALKGEGIDTAPLARQAVQDINNGGFRVTPGGLGGYPDTFLRSLLGPDATKELYLKADIARRLAENYNPSGSGKVVLGASQLIHPVAGVAAQAARARSMPQPATRFLQSLAESAEK
jgi:hypothetical protein